MQLTVEGKHLNVGDSLREHVRAHLSHTTEKYFRNPIEATVVFTKEKNSLYRADISVHAGSGIVLQAHHAADDPYPAFDVAAARVAKRLARYKDKLRDHHKKSPETLKVPYYTLESNENEDVSEAEGGTEPVVIAEMVQAVPTLAVADAVMRLELGSLPALLFKNPGSGAFNMVYRRKDGNIGWVDPGKPKSALTPVKKPAVKAVAPKTPAPKKALARKPAAKAKPKAKAAVRAAPKRKRSR